MNRGQRPVLVGVILLLLAIVTALVVEYFSGSAATASVSTAKPHLAASSPSAPTSTSRTYQTTGTDVNLRASATTASTVVITLGGAGSPVTLSCYVSGQAIFGDVYWYLATYAGHRGYISGYWVNTGSDPASTVLPHC